MKQILWFRRDLRITDSALLSKSKENVLPIFIFDPNLLNKLSKNDKRMTFIYNSVLNLKKELQSIGLNLKIFYDTPENIFNQLKEDFDEVLASCDFDNYSIQRDFNIEKIIPLKRYYDSWLIHPNDGLKSNGDPYKVYTPFYKSLVPLWSSTHIEEYKRNTHLKLIDYDYDSYPTLNDLGFEEQKLVDFLNKSALVLIEEFKLKLNTYEKDRDLFFKDSTSNLAVHLRFGLISPREVFNLIRPLDNSDFFIKELIWREFYNYILFHYPYSETENFNEKIIDWNNSKSDFKKWCEGNTGVPIIDAAMRHFNKTGTMHNRLRMVVGSFLTKNLFLPWQWGEEYFAKNLMDYEASSNIGSWQWCSSTGADAAPYFRVFNPYSQSERFDKEGVFIKSILPELKDCNPKLFHKENGLQDCDVDYPLSIVDIKKSRKYAIDTFAKGKDKNPKEIKEDLEF